MPGSGGDDEKQKATPLDDFRTIDVDKALASAKKKRRKCPSPIKLFLRIPPEIRNPVLAVFSVALGAFTFGHFMCNPVNYLESSTARPRSRSASAGDTTTLKSKSGDVVAVVPKKSDFDRLTDLSVAGDLRGIDQMIASGQILIVPNGTRARVIQHRFSGYEVRLKEGIFEGQSGWVADGSVVAVNE